MQNYFDVFHPEGDEIPVLIDVPHAGEWIPDYILDQMVVKNETLKRDLDLYTDQFWIDAPQYGATLIRSNVSRYVIDQNRAADDVSEKTVKGGKRIDKPGYYQDRGVVWRTTTDRTAVMDGPMSQEAFQDRIATFHAPYHQTLEREIARLKEKFGFVLLIDGHSMPSRGRAGHKDEGNDRADIVPGDLSGESCDPAISKLVTLHFEEEGFSVRPNDPYKGAWITRHYSEPTKNIQTIQIEVSRALYMNEKSFDKKPAGIDRLLKANMKLLPKLAELIEKLHA